MRYHNIPKKRKLLVNEDGVLYPSGLKTNQLTLLNESLSTNGDVDIHVTTSGSDTLGDGTASRPYATITKALDMIPPVVNHTVHVKVDKGFYTTYPDEFRRFYGREGQVTLEGIGDPDVVAGPFTIDSIDYDANWIVFKLGFTGVSWSSDVFYGKWIKFTDGTMDEYHVPIFSNTSDTIIAPAIYPGGTPTEVTIVEPPVTVSGTTGIQFESSNQSVLAGENAVSAFGNNPDSTHLSIGAIKFETSDDVTSPYAFVGGNYSLSFVTLKTHYAPVAFNDTEVLDIRNAKINTEPMTDVSSFDNALLAVEDGGFNFQITQGDVPPGTKYPTANDVDFVRQSGYESSVYGLCTRGGVWGYGLYCYTGFSVVGRLYNGASRPSWMQCAFVYVNPCGMYERPVKIGYMCKTNLTVCSFVDTAAYGSEIIKLEEFAEGKISYLSVEPGPGGTTNDYAFRMGELSRVLDCGGVTLSGTVDDIMFASTGGEASYPSSGARVTDNLGSSYMVQ